MADSPEYPSILDREYSPAVRRLAERYSMTPEAIEQIVSGASAGSTVTAAQANPDQAPPIVTRNDAVVNAPIGESSAEPKTARRVPPARTASGPGLPIAIVIVVLIGLGVALSFKQGCYRQRGLDESLRPNMSDTLQSQQIDAAKQASQPPVQPTPVTPPQVPPEALNKPRESPAGTTGPPAPTTTQPAKSAASNHSSYTKAAKPVLTTSSRLQAEEQLAELRANGNMRARIATHGSGAKRTYRIYTR